MKFQASRKEWLLWIGITCAIAAASAITKPCDLRETEHGGVCVCSDKYCDFLDDPVPENNGKLIIVSSSKAGQRFAVDERDFQSTNSQTETQFRGDANTRAVKLKITREKKYQKIVGFGGSVTGSVTYLLNQLPQVLQDNIYKSYYAVDGLGFNLMRMPIGGCDFDLEPWAYNEYPENDLRLTNLTTLDPRDEMRVAQIKRLIAVAEPRNLRIKGAAWSAPKWMKTNNEWTGFGRVKRTYYKTWAQYHLKWLELMENNGLPIWAISTGNEPLNGVFFMFFIKFMSLGWTPRTQAVWLNDHLGPLIRESKYKNLIIFNNDDQRYTLPWWLRTMNATRPGSLDYVDGVAVHWYWDEAIDPRFLKEAQNLMPNRMFINTESCVGDKPWEPTGPVLGSWERGEKYVRAFLEDLQHNFHGWIDWNIVLDEQGGPNYVDNFVDAPIIVNTTSFTEVYKQPMFYTMGHFSKFIPEDSMRIETIRSNVNVDLVAFERPNGTIAVVVYNSGKADVDITLEDSVLGTAIFTIPPKSIHTLLYV